VSTRDGVRVTLQANVDRLEDLWAARHAGADGVGLYRSEFLLTGHDSDLITEEYQYLAYRRLVEAAAGHQVTIRAFDVDDRQLTATTASLHPRQAHAGGRPTGHAGLRGIRASLAHPKIFKSQIRAVLRAAALGPVRIMFPFVSGVEEVRAARRLVEEAREELGEDRTRSAVPVGVMIEVPAAALMAGALAREVDFFTLGTNDLIQYTLAVDRTDERVSGLYQPLHPAVLRLVRLVQRAAAREGIPVSICGEMASDPVMLQVLIGLGLRTFSMAPGAIGIASRVIQQISAAHVTTIAARVLRLGSVADIETYLGDALNDMPANFVSSIREE
jgi:phosphotransferase system enzyme I (PtsI)